MSKINAENEVKKARKSAPPLPRIPTFLDLLSDGIDPHLVGIGPTWDEVDNDLLVETIKAVTGAGAMITFSRTKSGKSLGVSLYADGRPARFYADNVEDAESVLTGICTAVDAEYQLRQQTGS